MKKFLMLILASLSSLLTSPLLAFAPCATGKELLEYCKIAMDIHDRQFGYPQTDPEYILGTKAGICEGYLMSANEMHCQTQYAKNYACFCLPLNYDLLIGASVVVKYLKNHPEQQHLSASLLVAKSFATYFPCYQR